METKASCACGAVSAKVTSPEPQPLFACHCHCGVCRRVTSAPFFWGVGFKDDTVELVGNEIDIWSHEAVKGGVTRKGCNKCGTFVVGLMPDVKFLPGALLYENDPKTAAPAGMHIFYEDRAVDCCTMDGLTKFKERPGGEVFAEEPKSVNKKGLLPW
eukprot:CAMPEP_0113944290 /NCGR_PEP_ID=MMETSP1339-20121228/32793_1 /TAXON_ID=94617 /ORGANISM="Fibrocapsa japonica" /LENGTH=156 /DNA_ID=CAMNT_0000949447 /DNA_START=38 /DNA_END=505 /DNA_ORIENTATION=- /assembly_acc=CAM_ASM_000762